MNAPVHQVGPTSLAFASDNTRPLKWKIPEKMRQQNGQDQFREGLHIIVQFSVFAHYEAMK